LDPAFYLHAVPDPESQTNADPDPDKTFESFLYENIPVLEVGKSCILIRIQDSG
jgi:hypothetical protein